MLYKPLFVVHATVKALLKSYNVVQNEVLSYKGGCGTHTLNFYKHARFQVSVQLNEVPQMFYYIIKSKQTRNK